MPAIEPARAKPKITFGLIVLNGEPFTRYLLRTIYPFAHEIIAVEGAAPAARAVATAGGHSNDGTLEILHDFQKSEDPESKVTILTAEDHGYLNGFWPGEKHEQSQAYAERATGDYLWQVDVDEFYQPADMARVVDLLQADPAITMISFSQITFWGGFDYWADSWYLQRIHAQTNRIFKWGQGYRYTTHRPPTVTDEQGRDLRGVKWITGSHPAVRGIQIYHYSLLFPKQVLEKCKYYGQAEWARRDKTEDWANQVYLGLKRPYRVHNVYEYPSWLSRFSGEHPPQIQRLRADIRSGVQPIELRSTDDIEQLLSSPAYRFGRSVLQRTAGLAGSVAFVEVWRARFRSFRRNPRRFFKRLEQRVRDKEP